MDNIRPEGEEKINKIRNYGTSEVEQHWTKGLENYKNNIFNSVDVTSKPSVCKRDSDLKNHLMADHETLGSSSRWGIDTNCRSQKSNLQIQVSRWNVAEDEDSLAPAYRELVRELEEHRRHFKVHN